MLSIDYCFFTSFKALIICFVELFCSRKIVSEKWVVVVMEKSIVNIMYGVVSCSAIN